MRNYTNSLALFLALLAGKGSALVVPRVGTSILMGNDDGWATANVRTLFNTLTEAGFDTLLSCPAENKSGSASRDEFPEPIGPDGGQFGTIPPNSPSIGADPENPRLNYVNSFPVTALKNGLKLSSEFFGAQPDLVVTGPNVGENISLIAQFSGTVGAAVEAAKQGIPAIAFSGVGGEQHSFTEPDNVAPVYAELALKVVQTVIAAGEPYVPPGHILNVNFSKSNEDTCTSASEYRFVMTRVNNDINPFDDDVETCGSTDLPLELSVVRFKSGCNVAVSVMDAGSKADADEAAQKIVRDKLQDLFTCI